MCDFLDVTKENQTAHTTFVCFFQFHKYSLVMTHQTFQDILVSKHSELEVFILSKLHHNISGKIV